MNNSTIKPTTVSLIQKILRPWVDQGVIGNQEFLEVTSQLRSLSRKGELLTVEPRLVDRKELAAILKISVSNLKAIEKSGELPVKQKKLGGAIRYSLIDVTKWILSQEDEC